ncbi:MAG: 1-acyl-sn-glycerol-3-phosphate acyltransferase [Bacteroides sp.]|nr:1-acyl-sn-glycerol-3-phosphate acyltransferase [Bacteroides sp.]MCM1085416.1 1-acyl-sn-glycerol-3-phosphate acyltransferase [Bacteroides sp.]
MKTFATFILRLMGWKVNDFIPPESRYVLIVAPHTSWKDALIGRLAFWTKKLPARFFIKKEFFVFPFGWLLKVLGGMPINREQAQHVVEHAVNLLASHEKLALIITPEGTRQRTERWKKGFYYIAKRARVPLYAGIVDYKTKTCTVLPEPLDTEQDLDALTADLRRIYAHATGREPEKFALPK